MIKNNPFITVALLIALEIALFNYLGYINYRAQEQETAIILSVVTIPVITFLLAQYIVEPPFKKYFNYLSVAMIVACVLLFVAIQLY